MAKQSKLIRAADVAEMLDLTVSRVYDYSRRGIIPAVRLGNLLRYDPEKIREFIENGGEREMH